MPQALEPRRRTALTANRHFSLRFTVFVAIAAAASPVLSPKLHAQGAFPAPLPGQTVAPATGGLSPFPPVGGGLAPVQSPAAFPSGGVAPMSSGFGPPPGPPQGGQNCMGEFTPLKAEAEKRALVIKEMGKRKAPPAEACKAIGAFAQAETKMIKYVEANGKRCGIPPQISQQMINGHKMTEQMQTKVCAAAEGGGGGGGSAPTLSEALGASITPPEANPTKRSGGSTFDTLSGNVLAR